MDYAGCVASEQRLGLRGWLVTGSLVVTLLSFVLPATWIEAAYCRGVFPWIQFAVVSVTGVIAWPLTFTVLVLVVIVWPMLGWRRWRRGRQRGVRRRVLLAAGLLRIARVLLYTVAAFLLTWGIGYRRVPIEDRWQLGPNVEAAAVHDVSLRLLAIIRRDVPVDGAIDDEDRAFAAIAAAERQIVTTLEGWTPVVPANIKHPPAGVLLAMGIYGVCYPFTLEANVDPALPLTFRLAIGAHELAHVLGYCGEADANLVSFVAGLRAEDPLARYSTALSMMRYAFAGVSIEEGMWLRANLPKRARDDLAALAAANRDYRLETVAKIQSSLNDTYLKTQGVALGTGDYERGLRLFVRAYQKGMVAMPEPFDDDKE